MKVSEFIDRAELVDLVARLARAVDRCDREQILDCYLPQSFDDHGRFRGSGAEFADFICDPSHPLRSRSPWMFHSLGQSVFDVDGDRAYGETYFSCAQERDGSIQQSYGRYIDQCRKSDGRWRIRYRRVVMDWAGILDGSPLPFAHARGTRDAGDPLYERLDWPTDQPAPADGR